MSFLRTEPAIYSQHSRKHNKNTFSAKHSLVTGEQDSPMTEAANFSKQPEDWNVKPYQAGRGKKYSSVNIGNTEAGCLVPLAPGSTSCTHNLGLFVNQVGEEEAGAQAINQPLFFKISNAES